MYHGISSWNSLRWKKSRKKEDTEAHYGASKYSRGLKIKVAKEAMLLENQGQEYTMVRMAKVLGIFERGYFRWCKRNNGPVKNTAILSKMNKTSFGRVRTVMGTEQVIAFIDRARQQEQIEAEQK